MTPLQGVLILRILTDIAIVAGYSIAHNVSMAIMFAGIAVADFGALCGAH